MSNGHSVFYQPAPANPDGYELPFHLDTKTTSAACVNGWSHAWSAQHLSWNNGKMDNWIPTHSLPAYDGPSQGPLLMGYYTRADIPFYYALADAFTINDAYHCSVMGPTNPNRLYWMTGTVDPEGKNGGPVVDNSETPPYTWTTYPERLEKAGISWKVYQEADNYDDNALAWFKQYQTAPPTSPLAQKGVSFQPNLIAAFAEDVRNNNLPQVSWLIRPAAASEHPNYLPAAGEVYTYKLLQALASNPRMWKKTVFILSYDENDGAFDHVVPPTPPPGTPDEYVSGTVPGTDGVGGPIGLGFRVPLIVISPWSIGGYVSSRTSDHTSQIKFLEAVFGVHEPNISDWRRRTVGDLTETLHGAGGNEAQQFMQLPDPSTDLLDQYITCQDQPYPTVPNPQTVPHQEPGTRPHV